MKKFYLSILASVIFSLAFFHASGQPPTVSITGTPCANSVLTLNSSVLPTKIVWSYNSVPFDSAFNSWQAASQTLIQVGQLGGIPVGVCIDKSGNLYYSDGLYMTVNKLAPGATSAVVVAGISGTAGSANNQLNQPAGIFVDAAGNIYIAEEVNNRVTKWAPGATSGITVAGTGTAGNGNDQLSDPRGVYVDGAGNVYVADGNNNRIMKWAPSASSGTMVAGTGVAGNGNDQLTGPNSVYVDANGSIYISDGGNNRVMKWLSGATSGTMVAGTGTAGAAANQLNIPSGIFVDGLGNIYVGDAHNNRVQLWTPNASTGITIAGGNGAGGAANQLNNVGGVFIDSSSNLFVADIYSGKVKEFPSVINNTVTSNPPGTYSATATINTGNTSSTTFTVLPPPAISSQPSNKEICAGGNTTFTISTSGGPIANYQWQVNTGGSTYNNITDGGIYTGSSTASLSVSSATDNMSGYKYQCIVTGTCPPVLTSNAATLTVDTLPVIKVQPSPSAICAGNNTTFTTTAAGTGITYQWYVRQGTGNFGIITDGGLYSGSMTNTLTITGVPATMNGYTYHCVVSGTCSPIATTNDVLLTVNTSPVVITDPQNTTVCANGLATFNVTATGTNRTYQWKVNNGSGFTNVINGGIYSGANSSTLNISPVSNNMSGYTYECFVGGTCTPAVTSGMATLTVDTLPAIITQPPTNGIICENTSTSFSVTAIGTGITYQWQVKAGSGSFTNITNGPSYSGANNSTLDINNGNAGLNGNQYRLVVSGTCVPSVMSNVITLSVNSAPGLSTQPALTTVCEGQNTSFSVTATGSGLVYQWQQNTGNGIFNNISDNATFSGTATNTLTISNAQLSLSNNNFRIFVTGTCSPSIISNGATLIVNPTPVPTITATGPAIVCPGDTVQLAANFVPGYTYQWLHGSNQTPITNATGTIYYATTTDVYTIKETNPYQCSAIASPTSVLINPAPQVTILHPGPLCSDRNEVLYATYDATWTYQWGYDTINNGNHVFVPITGATLSNYTANNAGNYTVLVTNSIGCPTVPSLITINQTPTAQISRSGSITACSEDTLNLSSSGVDLLHQWLVNGSPDINGTQIDYTAHIGAPGAYQYAVVVTENGCADTSATLTVTAKPLPPAAITLYGPATLCNNSNVALQANAPALNHVLYYQWQFNGANVNGAVYATYLANAVGTYTLKTDDLSGCYGTASVDINSDAPFTPSITVNGNEICADNNPIYTFYQWSLNGVAINGANSQCFTPLVVGAYTVTVKDTAGCTNTSAITNITHVGVGNINLKDDIKVYPNPATNMIHIDAPVTVNISIMSLEGRVVLQQNAAKDVDLSKLANGVYMMAIYDTNNTLITNEKLVKTGL